MAGRTTRRRSALKPIIPNRPKVHRRNIQVHSSSQGKSSSILFPPSLTNYRRRDQIQVGSTYSQSYSPRFPHIISYNAYCHVRRGEYHPLRPCRRYHAEGRHSRCEGSEPPSGHPRSPDPYPGYHPNRQRDGRSYQSPLPALGTVDSELGTLGRISAVVPMGLGTRVAMLYPGKEHSIPRDSPSLLLHTLYFPIYTCNPNQDPIHTDQKQ